MSGVGVGSVGSFQERVLVPRKYVKSPAPQDDDDDDEVHHTTLHDNKTHKGADNRQHLTCA